MGAQTLVDQPFATAGSATRRLEEPTSPPTCRLHNTILCAGGFSRAGDTPPPGAAEIGMPPSTHAASTAPSSFSSSQAEKVAISSIADGPHGSYHTYLTPQTLSSREQVSPAGRWFEPRLKEVEPKPIFFWRSNNIAATCWCRGRKPALQVDKTRWCFVERNWRDNKVD